MYQKPISEVEVISDVVIASNGSRWETPIDPD